MSRARPAARASDQDPALSYVRDTDTPVALTDVVEALERLTQLAEVRDDGALADAARHVHALVTALRAQFISDLTGARPPYESAVDRARPPRRAEDEPPPGGGSWLQAAR